MHTPTTAPASASKKISRRGVLATTAAGTLAVATASLAPARAAEPRNIKQTAGLVSDSRVVERESLPIALREETESWIRFPFHQFEVEVAPQATEVQFEWQGSANPGARLRLMVFSPSLNGYEEITHTFADAQGNASFNLLLTATNRVENGKMLVTVQHSAGWAGNNLSQRFTPVAPENPADTDRATYDFTLAWETDTQFYSEEFPQRQRDIHDYLLRNRTSMNIQYLFHTGDIVDEYYEPHQFANADTAYSVLDQENYPYGVLAGNHDVLDAQKAMDYSEYSRYFGLHRFQTKPWFGGDHKNNRGHFDLISAGGHDFLMLFMGWGAEDEEIAWMNRVLADYPERTAIVALHQYIDPAGKLAETPQRIKDEVIAANNNVRMVLSGHHHGAMVTRDYFGDRTVVNVLFDPQDLPEGGQSFLRLMHFDNYGGVVTSRTYSPYLKKYNSSAPELPRQYQDFTIPYSDLGLKARKKTLLTKEFRARAV